MRVVWPVLVLLGLAGCAGRDRAVQRYDVAPAPDDWGAHPGAPMEWWYVSGLDAGGTVAFHAAFFRAPVPKGRRPLGIPLRLLLPCTYSLAAVSVTDLLTGERHLAENSDVPLAWACAGGPPLCLRLGSWALTERGPGRYTFEAGPLRVRLEATAPRVVHPPGWVGGGTLGALAYQSVPRLNFAGTWRGRRIAGLAWMDHQWGDLIPGESARWDWHGLHLSDGSSVMLCRLTRLDGTDVHLHGSRTDAQGAVHPLEGLTITPLGTWRGTHGRQYATTWRVQALGLHLTVRPLRPDQETPSLSGVTYWEGPVSVEGHLHGQPVRGTGFGEHFPLP